MSKVNAIFCTNTANEIQNLKYYIGINCRVFKIFQTLLILFYWVYKHHTFVKQKFKNLKGLTQYPLPA